MRATLNILSRYLISGGLMLSLVTLGDRRYDFAVFIVATSGMLVTAAWLIAEARHDRKKEPTP
jgi:hypothetical protein